MTPVYAILQSLPDPAEPLSGPQRVARQRTAARQVLVQLAQQIGAPLEGWRQNEGRVPLPNAGWYWSISHKPGMVAAAIDREPVGIDVELLQSRRSTGVFQKIARSDEWARCGVVSEELQAAMAEQSARTQLWNVFFRLWTAKEAVLKANGRGVGEFDNCQIQKIIDMQQLSIEYQSQLWIVEQKIVRNHLAAVATNRRIVQWVISE
ncbi:MAG: hypothetical protein HJJLKODD_00249 [Phycisphaerae bacterium]|nr:hypothetical protein [Phycisphaerae bacterium]